MRHCCFGLRDWGCQHFLNANPPGLCSLTARSRRLMLGGTGEIPNTGGESWLPDKTGNTASLCQDNESSLWGAHPINSPWKKKKKLAPFSVWESIQANSIVSVFSSNYFWKRLMESLVLELMNQIRQKLHIIIKWILNWSWQINILAHNTCMCYI